MSVIRTTGTGSRSKSLILTATVFAVAIYGSDILGRARKH